jgi:transcriptional regulator
LTDQDVKRMHELSAQGAMQKDIAPQFGISPKQVSVILAGKQWGHVGRVSQGVPGGCE